jgi:eukaryotic translation initiation factor 2C
MPPPRQPSSGRIHVNVFPVDLPTEPKAVWRFHVTVEPEMKDKDHRRELLDVALGKSANSNYAYDAEANLYVIGNDADIMTHEQLMSAKKLKETGGRAEGDEEPGRADGKSDDNGEGEMTPEERQTKIEMDRFGAHQEFDFHDRKYTVGFMFIREEFVPTQLSHPEQVTTLQAFITADQMLASNDEYKMRHMGRQLVQDPTTNRTAMEKAHFLSDVAIAAKAYVALLLPAHLGALLTVDVSNAAMAVPMPLTEYARIVAPDPRRWSQVLRGTQAVSKHMGYTRKHTLSGISTLGANQIEFEVDDRKTNVADYFQQRYKIKLKDPAGPCAEFGSKGSFMPLELLEIPDGKRKTPLTDSESQALLDISCRAPIERGNEIAGVSKLVQDGGKLLSKLDVHISSTMLTVTAQVLDPATLSYKKSKVEHKTAWDLRGLAIKTPYAAKPLQRVLMVNAAPHFVKPDAVKITLQAMDQCFNATGMPWDSRSVTVRDFNTRMMGKELPGLQDACKKVKPEMIIVLLPDANAPVYEAFKEFADANRCPSQCMQGKHCKGDRGPAPQLLANLALKMNEKLGGNNWTLDGSVPFDAVSTKVSIGPQDVLYIGVDVHHPMGGSTNPSVAAMVASLGTRHYAAIRQLPCRQELLGAKNVADMFQECCARIGVQTKTSNKGRAIKHCVLFRDGVGEGNIASGQFVHVEADNMADCLPASCAFTVLVISKRHHVRMFEEATNGQFQNVQAGTYIDARVTRKVSHNSDTGDEDERAVLNDFYMVSHPGLKGTSTPTYYQQINMARAGTAARPSADDVQTLLRGSFDLCFVHTRSTRAVGMPAPAYFAHLAAFRARNYVDKKQRIAAAMPAGMWWM